jgi:hypothetical protein
MVSGMNEAAALSLKGEFTKNIMRLHEAGTDLESDVHKSLNKGTHGFEWKKNTVSFTDQLYLDRHFPPDAGAMLWSDMKWKGFTQISGDDHRFIPDNAAPTGSVPEPSTILLLGSGILGFIALRKKAQ